ncbi:kinase-like domain-containing protein [Powellomyces hirtus]|nr:kinase-like domain-containing protein [Powellomyces hirtus]
MATTRSRKRRDEQPHFINPHPQLRQATAATSTSTTAAPEVIVVDSRSPSPATPRLYHPPISQHIYSQERTLPPPQPRPPPASFSVYHQQPQSDMAPNVRYQHNPQPYLPPYGPPSYYQLAPPVQQHELVSSQYYAQQASSPVESAQSYATPADSNFRGETTAALRLPPPPGFYQPRPAQYLPPQMNDCIDLTHSPPSINGGGPAKRRKMDDYYDQRFLQNTVTAYNQQPYAPGVQRQPSPPQAWKPPVAQGQTPENLPPCSDKEGFFIVTDDCEITPRYKVLKLLGQGTFGRVLEVYDRHENRKVAIKVVRALPKYSDASRVEIKVLKCLEDNDPYHNNHCIQLLETFIYRKHTCMVFPLLSQSVFDYLKENSFVPFLSHQTAEIAFQLVEAVVFMHRIKLIHTDLKPDLLTFVGFFEKSENIMIVDNTSVTVPGARRTSKPRKKLVSTEIRLIDFGSSIFQDDYHSTIVSTRHYRAPEILLGAGWSYPCDIWSLGCILVEFVTGDALFQTHENIEHLAMMEAVLGPIPPHLTTTTTAAKYFENGLLQYPRPDTTRQSRKSVSKTKALRDIIAPKDELAEHLLDLVHRMLRYDPAERITARDALGHPYFSQVIAARNNPGSSQPIHQQQQLPARATRQRR